MAKQPQIEPSLLTAALNGLEYERARLDAVISEIKGELGQRERPSQAASVAAEQAAPKRGGMSAAGKRRIAAAQRKRWAALKASQAEPAKAAPKKAKRKMSRAGRAAIIAATKKRWAAYRKARANA